MQVNLSQQAGGQSCLRQQSVQALKAQAKGRPGMPAKAAARVSAKAAKVEEAVTAASSNGVATSNPLDFDELTDIIRMVHDTDIVELELKSKRFSLAVRKKEAVEAHEPTVIYQAAPQQAAQQYAPPAPQYAPLPAMPSAPTPAPAAAPASAPSASSNGQAPGGASDGVPVLSPMAGMVYRSPAPGEPPFVKVGDKVKKGQTICIIEAMKLMNEIESETSGTVMKIMADNGSSVNPGQPLVLIKP